VNGALRRAIGGVVGGLLGGALFGFCEAWWSLAFEWETVSLDIVPYALVMYALVGALAGAGMGIGLGLLGLIHRREARSDRVTALVLGAFFGANVLVVGRYRVFRDVMKEKAIPLPGMLALLAVAGGSFLLFWLVGRRLLARKPFSRLASPLGAVAAVVLLVVVFAIVAALGGEGAEAPATVTREASTRPGVILIMVDTLRWDYLSCYDPEKVQTPHIDALAKDGVLFENMFANATWTRPSVATILTGLYPTSHSAVRKPDIMPDAVTTLAERLSEAGVYTAGFANHINVAPPFNFQQGFQEYHYLSPDYFFHANASSAQLAYYNILRKVREKFLSRKKWVQHYYQEAEVVNGKAREWLAQHGKQGGYFLFLHYMDPHDPYFEHPYHGVGYARVQLPNPDPELAPVLEQTYRGEVAYLDRKLGELFDWMKEQGLYESTAIVLTADHGEEFYEHQGWWHGTTMYEEQLRVPLIIKLPGVNLGGLRADMMVNSIDIAPTVMEMLQLQPPAELPGRSLLSVGGFGLQGRTVFAEGDFEGNVLACARAKDWKLIRANKENPRGLPPLGLFDMIGDPGETRNVAEGHPDKVAELDRVIKGTLTQAKARAVEGQTTELGEDEIDALRSLGYIQ